VLPVSLEEQQNKNTTQNAGIILFFIFKTIIEYKYRSIIENKH
jgi:hypothetical protein